MDLLDITFGTSRYLYNLFKIEEKKGDDDGKYDFSRTVKDTEIS